MMLSSSDNLFIVHFERRNPLHSILPPLESLEIRASYDLIVGNRSVQTSFVVVVVFFFLAWLVYSFSGGGGGCLDSSNMLFICVFSALSWNTPDHPTR